jgi:hypothetical protein
MLKLKSLFETLQPESKISDDLRYHIDHNIPISENVFRHGSKKFFDIINEARQLWLSGFYHNDADNFVLESEIGYFGEYQGRLVPLDLIMTDDDLNESEYKGKDVELNRPKRGGIKKFYVYVKDPKSGNIRKVSFGAKSGGGKLSVKFKDPKRRKAFADRHNCKEKTDKTSPGYWACRLPRYAQSLGLGSNMNTYW